MNNNTCPLRVNIYRTIPNSTLTYVPIVSDSTSLIDKIVEAISPYAKGASNAVGDCIAQSLTIELPVMLVLAPLPVTLASTAAHVLGCSLRKGIKAGFDYDVDDSLVSKVATLAAAGATGGAAKYGVRYMLTKNYVAADLLKTSLYGALNNGLYELENLIPAKFSSIKAASPLAIEGVEETLKGYLKGGTVEGLKNGLIAGGLISLAGNFAYPNFNPPKIYEALKDTYLNPNDPIVGTVVNATSTLFAGEASDTTTEQDL